MSNCLFALGPYISPMTNVLLTDLGLSIPLSFLDKCISTSLDSTIFPRKMCMAHVSIVTEEYLGFPHWLWFSNCFQSSNSINLKCCKNTCEYFILTKKKNCQMDNYGKFEFSIDILAFELGKLCPGWGFLFRFFDPGAGVLHWKAVPGRGFWRKK